jgi:hypothetical protein
MVAYKQGEKQRRYGPFKSRKEAMVAALPFTQEGLDTEIGIDNPICDFCSSSDVTWSYDAADYILDEKWGSRGGWAACDECHDLIEADDRLGLARRAVDAFFLLNPGTGKTDRMELAIRIHVAEAHNGFFDTRSEAVPYVEGDIV